LQLLPPRYTNPRPLQRGSFGAVYVAEDSALGRSVAVKVLAQELAADVTSRLRFEREVLTAAALGDHPHVVTVHDAGEWRGRPYLVMELLAGSVAERLRSGPVDERLALRWLAQAADALDFAHARGIVHRDVKPANLLLDARDEIRLSDFGVVRHEPPLEELTVAGAVVGTPGYLAPEVAAGGGATAASDRYSLAVVARDLLGEREALSGGLAADPEARYPSAAALVVALRGDEQQTRVAALPPTRIAGLPVTRVMSRAPSRPQRRHRAVRFGRAAAVLALVAAASAAAGAYLAPRLSALAQASFSSAVVRTCAVSPLDHDANVLFDGVTTAGFCRSQAHALQLSGGTWTYRNGGELFAPDHGTSDLEVVCRLRSGQLRLTVYDSGSQSIGKDVCAWYASGGWRDSAVT